MKRRAFVSSLAAWPMAAAAARPSEEGKIRGIAEGFSTTWESSSATPHYHARYAQN
jgi:hypothetical protein